MCWSKRDVMVPRLYLDLGDAVLKDREETGRASETEGVTKCGLVCTAGRQKASERA